MNTKSTVVLAIILVVMSSIAIMAQAKPEQLAQQAAESWLAVVDNGDYAVSWDQAAAMFKTAVTKHQWNNALDTTRKPLGKVLSRKITSATYTKSLPGAPAGEYVVIQYETSFENRHSATETVTPMLDKDGKWRVSGYYIK